MKRCPSCASDIPANQENCPNCATSTPRPTSTPTATSQTAKHADLGASADGSRLQVGESLGKRYVVSSSLGSGGMGEVYKAEQYQPIRRTVALKLIKLGMDTEHIVARFESERQALALMSHPNVARVYDAGTTDRGRPYFAMEYVEGAPVTAYCDEQRLTTEARLGLFLQVCEGIQHAHQKGIIHRDVKPSNVLVTRQDGSARPVVIDFGVAKAIGKDHAEKTLFTQQGALVGTPEYMSPEQADPTNIDVDTRADVYSLGVLLYELLVGARPFEVSRRNQEGLIGILRLIRDEVPAKPSSRVGSLGPEAEQAARNRGTERRSLERNLHGDLDWITMKALEKDRTRRYGSPAELAADVRRHLALEPVLAGPPSALYRSKRFVRRHAVGVAFGVALFMLSGGIAARERIQTGRIASERDRANEEAVTARQISGVLMQMFEVSDPGEARGHSITAEEILEAGVESIERELHDKPLVQARMMRTIGSLYGKLGLYEPAESLLERALEVHEQHLGIESLEVASDQEELGLIVHRRYEFKRSKELADRVLATRRLLLPPDHPDLARALREVGSMWLQSSRPDEAMEFLEQALAIQDEVLEPNHPDLTQTLLLMGVANRQKGDHEAAIALYRRVVTLRENRLGPDHVEVANGQFRIASVLAIRLGRYEEAEEPARKAVDAMKSALGNRSFELGRAYRNLGRIQFALGRYNEAESVLEQAIEVSARTYGSAHWETVSSLVDLAKLHLRTGDLGAAEADLERTAVLIDELQASDEGAYFDHAWLVASLLWHRGDRANARSAFENLLEQLRGEKGDHHYDYLYHLARFHALFKRKQSALFVLRRAVQQGWDRPAIHVDAEWDPLRGDPDFEMLVDQVRAGSMRPNHWRWAIRYTREGSTSRAKKEFELAFAQLKRDWGPDAPETRYHWALYCAATGAEEEALRSLRQALDLGFADPRIYLDPELDTLRSNPEFDRLAANIAMPPM